MGCWPTYLQFVGDRAAALNCARSWSKSRQTTPAHGKNLAASLANGQRTRPERPAPQAQQLAPNDPGVLDAVGWTFDADG